MLTPLGSPRTPKSIQIKVVDALLWWCRILVIQLYVFPFFISVCNNMKLGGREKIMLMVVQVMSYFVHQPNFWEGSKHQLARKECACGFLETLTFSQKKPRKVVCFFDTTVVIICHVARPRTDSQRRPAKTFQGNQTQIEGKRPQSSSPDIPQHARFDICLD